MYTLSYRVLPSLWISLISLPLGRHWSQYSALGTVAFTINASSLKCMTPGNVAVKYADDNYLIVGITAVVP